MHRDGPWPTIALTAAVVLATLAAGGVRGIGPLAAMRPAQEVTDPREMAARSLQTVLDADAVHIDGTLSGSLPGALVERPERSVSLDGSTLSADVRPHDAKTRAHVVIPGLQLTLDSVTVWNDAWYRFDADGPWLRTTAGDASAQAGVDINPLTFVDRLRTFLDSPDVSVSASDVPCSSASGRCHEIRIDAGTDPAHLLALALPDRRGANLPAVPTIITLDTDARTLRPAHLSVVGASADGTVVLHLVLDASGWNGDVVIDQPAG